jgi:sirohydrochlorin cobaltochelatase
MAKFSHIAIFLCVALLLVRCHAPQTDKGVPVTTNKQAILLVAFGTTVPRAAEAFARFETATNERFPEAEVRWAYTSSIVRKRLAERGEAKPSVGEALEQLAREGYGNIAVQSLHTIAGVEYHKLLREITMFRHKPEAKGRTVNVGRPLLAGYADAERVANAMVVAAPAEREPEAALVFMGHGSEHHASDLAYVALASILRNIDNRAILATVEGHPTFEDALEECSTMGTKQAYLVPFMAVAGDHAINDMAGEEDDSWKSLLEKQGITCEPVLEGTLDNIGIRDVWLDHLQDALAEEK